MAVYVDPALWAWGGRRWCHLLADDEAELHAFAAALGIERRRFQHRADAPWRDHYDVAEDVRAKAILLGATEISVHDAGRLVRNRRPVDGPRVVEFYWRRGCRFCGALRQGLERAGVELVEHDIWADDTARAFVRSVARGTETVPTVVVAGAALVNPSVAEVVAHLDNR